jgi:hypothetical protein
VQAFFIRVERVFVSSQIRFTIVNKKIHVSVENDLSEIKIWRQQMKKQWGENLFLSINIFQPDLN